MTADFSSVVAEGDYRRSLESLRDLLAQSIAEVEPKERAALARQLTSVLALIEGLPSDEKGSRLDELARRRADRRGEVSDGPDVGRVGGAGGGRARS